MEIQLNLQEILELYKPWLSLGSPPENWLVEKTKEQREYTKNFVDFIESLVEGRWERISVERFLTDVKVELQRRRIEEVREEIRPKPVMVKVLTTKELMEMF